MGNKERSTFIKAHMDENKKGSLIFTINLKWPDKNIYPCKYHGLGAYGQQLGITHHTEPFTAST